MSTKAFDLQEVLKDGWQNFLKAPVLLIGLLIISFAASIIMNVFFDFLPVLILSLVNGLVTSYFMLSFIRAAVMLSNGEMPAWDVLKNDMNSFFRFFIATLILSVIFLIASILLIIPLILAMAIFFPVPYIIVSKKDLPILDAFKTSWKITTPQFIPCLIFILVVFVLSIIGLIPLGLGLLVVIPVVYVAGATIYKKLEAAAGTTITN